MCPKIKSLVLLLAMAMALSAQGNDTKPEKSANPAQGPRIETGPRPAAADFGPWNDPIIDKLGYRPGQALEEFGAPQELSTIRGNEAWQDNVIFYYPDHSYLYWWGNRLWQIRFDKRYQGDVLGVKMGLSRPEVLKRLGNPAFSASDNIVYQLPDRGFPIRLRLNFTEDRLDDLYLYRADF